MMRIQKNQILILSILSTLLSTLGISASGLAAGVGMPSSTGWYSGRAYNESTSLSHIVSELKPGTILVVGESHGQELIQNQQMHLLNEIRRQGFKVSVGMEFFNYPDQETVQNFRNNVITEDQFKSQIQWGGYPFELYAPQLLFPQSALGEFGLALNMPRSVTGQISKGGLESLTVEQQKLMPPDFATGNAFYQERFYNIIGGGHVPADKLLNYFLAQSTWDETMAWQTLEFMQHHLDHVFVIIVGEFHVQYGGGLPDRLRQRIQSKGLSKELSVKTISQIWTEGLTEDDIQSEMAPSDKYGPRADYINRVDPSL